jgi:Thermostable hemolysin
LPALSAFGVSRASNLSRLIRAAAPVEHAQGHNRPGEDSVHSTVDSISATPARAARMSYRMEELRTGDAGREQLEAFVACRFADVHQARVKSFMPALLGMHDAQGALRCALGYRDAGADSLYLEQYLDVPVERAIADAWMASGEPASRIERGSVVEVGNLAGRGCRAAMHMVSRLPRYLIARGYQWVTFTATSRVRSVLDSFNAPLLDLGPADPARLHGDSGEWGEYYRCAPRVMAGFLPHGLQFRP